MALTPHLTVNCYYEAEITIHQSIHTIFFKLKQVFLGPNITKNVSSPSNMEHFTHFILEVAFQLLCRFKASYLRKGDMNTKRLYREATQHPSVHRAPFVLCIWMIWMSLLTQLTILYILVLKYNLC